MAVKKLLVYAVLTLAAPAVLADVLLMDEIASNAATAQQRPMRGMSMSRVEQEFGAPTEQLPAVGDPPITRWVYPDFTVYFEYKYVIHAVARVN
jgi:hypothetical protein